MHSRWQHDPHTQTASAIVMRTESLLFSESFTAIQSFQGNFNVPHTPSNYDRNNHPCLIQGRYRAESRWMCNQKGAIDCFEGGTRQLVFWKKWCMRCCYIFLHFDSTACTSSRVRAFERRPSSHVGANLRLADLSPLPAYLRSLECRCI